MCCHRQSRSMGAASASFEVQDAVEQDILTGIGFCFGLALTLRLFKYAPWLHTIYA